jgi:hypothetical protein
MPPATEEAVARLQGVPDILDLEKKEEARVAKALAANAEKEAAAQRAHEEERLALIAKETAAAEAEVTDFGGTELQSVIARGEEDRAAQLAAIDAGFKKHAADVTASLVERVTDPSFLKRFIP